MYYRINNRIGEICKIYAQPLSKKHKEMLVL